MGLLSGIIGGVSNIVGGLLGKESSENVADQNAAAQLEIQKRNEALQREFAQSGIRWRVEDAQKAGIHPLYAMGASLPTYSPSTYIPAASDTSWTQSFAQAGQDFGRAIAAGSTQTERHASRMEALAADRAELENAILRTRLAKENQSMLGPPIPEVRPETPLGSQHSPMLGIIEEPLPPYEVKRPEVMAIAPGHPTQEAGAHAGVRWERTPTGFKPHHSKELIEDADITSPPYLEWLWHNRVLPSVGIGHQPPPDSYLPHNATGWRWDALNQEYRPSFARREDWLGWLERAGPNWIPRRQ